MKTQLLTPQMTQKMDPLGDCVLYRLWYPGLILWPVHSWKTRAGKHSLAPDSGKDSHGRSAKGEEVRVVSAATVQELAFIPESISIFAVTEKVLFLHFRFPLPVLLSLLLILKPVLAMRLIFPASIVYLFMKMMSLFQGNIPYTD